ncbi:hypothetical protein ACFL0Y_03765 [Patescibacteria group bacterium]
MAISKQLRNYYTDLVLKKIDLSTEAFVKRIKKIYLGDWEAVEFIDNMMLEPIDHQVAYLAKKLNEALSRKKDEKQKFEN